MKDPSLVLRPNDLQYLLDLYRGVYPRDCGHIMAQTSLIKMGLVEHVTSEGQDFYRNTDTGRDLIDSCLNREFRTDLSL